MQDIWDWHLFIAGNLSPSLMYWLSLWYFSIPTWEEAVHNAGKASSFVKLKRNIDVIFSYNWSHRLCTTAQPIEIYRWGIMGNAINLSVFYCNNSLSTNKKWLSHGMQKILQFHFPKSKKNSPLLNHISCKFAC